MSFPGHLDDGRFRRMVRISFAIHVVVLAAYIFFPRGLFQRTPPVLMTISLGSGIGERTTGSTSIGAREVEKAAPPPKRPEPAKPTPPAKPDVMKVPAKTVPTPEKKPTVSEKAAPAPPTRPPVTGPEVTKGTAAAETGVNAQSPGLTVGGGGGTSAMLPMNFCCPEYATQFMALIQQNWVRTASQPGETIITFTIYKDGTISDPIVSKSSGSSLLDIQSKNAVRATKKMPPLPAAYPNPSLTVHMVFPDVR
jgi:TonB family protein